MKGTLLPLAQRKQDLLAQNAALRQEISRSIGEVEDGIRHLLGWIESGVQTGQKIKKGGFWLAGLGGLILGWKLLRGKHPASSHSEKSSLFGSLFTGGLRTFGLVGTAIKLWRNWSAVKDHLHRPKETEQRGDGHHGVTPRFKT